MLKIQFDFDYTSYCPIIFDVFINRFTIQERKISLRNRISKKYMEINIQTKHTKNRARVNTRAFL